MILLSNLAGVVYITVVTIVCNVEKSKELSKTPVDPGAVITWVKLTYLVTILPIIAFALGLFLLIFFKKKEDVINWSLMGTHIVLLVFYMISEICFSLF